MEISYPRAIRELSDVRTVAARHGLEVAEGAPGCWCLSLEADEPHPRRLKTFFAQLNDLRPPPPPFAESPLRGGAPLVSCIVAVNQNLPFVAEQLLPSLAASSMNHAIEIVLVCNGSAACKLEHEGVRTLRSEWGVVSKAYNAGAAQARGAYIAFLHDDCALHDPLWIEKCVQRLERGAHAVAGEYRQIDQIAGVAVPPLPVAKCVPLFLKKTDFDDAGGFDEAHYIGYEDLDFTLALAARGKKLVATDLDIVHFHGMSSTLKYSPVAGLADLYALCALPRFAVMRRFNEFWRTGLVSQGVNYMQTAMDAQLLYVLRKYRAFLSRTAAPAYAAAEAALQRQISEACAEGPQAALSRLRALDRQAAGLSVP
jgi:hypothetical protein